MTSELIKCPHCGYKYNTDVKKVVEDGGTIVLRVCLPNIKKLFRRKTPKTHHIDLICPNCKKAFEWEVKV